MKLLINFISKIGVDSLSRLIGFLTLPVITRAIGPDGYGLYSYLFVILSYFGFFVDFGYLSYGTNKLIEKSDSKGIVSRIISLQFLTLIFTYLVLITSGYFLFDPDKYILLLIFSITFLAQPFAIRYYYLANNKLYYSSVSELAGQLVYAVLIFLVFVNYNSVKALIIISVIQTIVTSVFLIIPFIKRNRISLDLNLKTNFKTLKDSYKLGLANKAEGITASFIILFTGIVLNDYSVGLFNASYKIYMILLTIVQGLSFTLMPVLLKNAKDPEKKNTGRISLIFYLYIFTGIFLCIMTFNFADIIISIIFGEKFYGSVLILKYFSLTILLWPVVMFNSLILLAYNRYNYILIVSIVSMILSIIFSFVFIKAFGTNGTGVVLPFVAIGTIMVSYIYLKKISAEERFNISDLFSLRNALAEIKKILKR